jgi:hypothetical protein
MKSFRKEMNAIMKKERLLIFMVLLLLFLGGCVENNGGPKDENNNNNGEQEPQFTVGDYYPFKENVKYSYLGEGNEYASYTVYVDYLKDNRIQTRTNNGGTEMVKVLENADGELTQILAQGECYYREDLTGRQADPAKLEVLLKEPLQQGTTWTLNDGRTRTITAVDVELSTPTGTYKALEVTTEGEHGKLVDYYAPEVGLVMTAFASEGMEVRSVLNQIENVPLTQAIDFYYPDKNLEKLVKVTKSLTFNTNDITRKKIEEAYKEIPDNGARVLTEGAEIKSLYYNTTDKMVHVDFNQAFISEMNAGSGYEGMILQGITNTLGNYYGVDKVYITVEGKPYSSGHYEMKKGEPFIVE